jgi:hypothetical protein
MKKVKCTHLSKQAEKRQKLEDERKAKWIQSEIRPFTASFVNMKQDALFEWLLVTGVANALPFRVRPSQEQVELLDLGERYARVHRGTTWQTDYSSKLVKPYGIKVVRAQEQTPAFVIEGLACSTKSVTTTLHWEKDQ